MKKKEVEVGRVYMARVSGRVVPVRLVGGSQYGGWNAQSLVTRRMIHVRTAARLRPAPTFVTDPRAWAMARCACGDCSVCEVPRCHWIIDAERRRDAFLRGAPQVRPEPLTHTARVWSRTNACRMETSVPDEP